MNFKALALATASAAVVTSASAADLPVVAEPVDYVQVCDAYGSGFFKLPGKDTCIRVGGRVRAQFISDNLNNDANYEDNDSYVRGYVRLTSMTDTEIGLIKTYTEIYSQWDEAGEGELKTDDAYIQFGTQYGDLLIGYAVSNFDTFTGSTDIGIVDRNISDTDTLQMTYTKSLGNGLTASLSLEDSSYREGGENEYDVVGGLKISQGWGFARLVGAYHQVNDDIENNGVGAVGIVGNEKDGFAIAGTVGINLNMLAEGDQLVFAVSYADAAGHYVNIDSDYLDGTKDSWDAKGYDAFSVAAGFTHYFTPEVAGSIDASYLMVDDADDYERIATTAALGWYPTSGLVIAGEVGYVNQDDDKNSFDANGNDHDYRVGTRIQYTF
ncbi:porin [Pseudovibrio exalbescens]|uniref:porin n=1 Tax=Pseudovibrio exalbescens TaxID=197461 RepID=UPI00236663FA|nr:porin [Pseudovibrio exalbescens]MDD7908350.1 porin [Pseudovibrio exalbescens]